MGIIVATMQVWVRVQVFFSNADMGMDPLMPYLPYPLPPLVGKGIHFRDI